MLTLNTNIESNAVAYWHSKKKKIEELMRTGDILDGARGRRTTEEVTKLCKEAWKYEQENGCAAIEAAGEVGVNSSTYYRWRENNGHSRARQTAIKTEEEKREKIREAKRRYVEKNRDAVNKRNREYRRRRKLQCD